MKIHKSMKKYFLLAFIPLFAITLAGCSYQTQAVSSQKEAQAKLEETQKRLQESVPVPTINNSQTRKAISERARLFDAENKVTYIYLVSYGKVMAFYPVKGQVVSLRSYLTPVEKIVAANGDACNGQGFGNCSGGDGDQGYVVATPDLDGTYGDNADGIFFFTADTNAYVEWKGDYMVSDQPLKLSTTPELIREIK